MAYPSNFLNEEEGRRHRGQMGCRAPEKIKVSNDSGTAQFYVHTKPG